MENVKRNHAVFIFNRWYWMTAAQRNRLAEALRHTVKACSECGGSGRGVPTLSEPDGADKGCKVCNGEGGGINV